MAKSSRKRSSGKLVGLAEVTKRDFVAIAGTLCQHHAPQGLVSDLSSYFKSQNPRFDESRFTKAASCKLSRK